MTHKTTRFERADSRQWVCGILAVITIWFLLP